MICNIHGFSFNFYKGKFFKEHEIKAGKIGHKIGDRKLLPVSKKKTNNEEEHVFIIANVKLRLTFPHFVYSFFGIIICNSNVKDTLLAVRQITNLVKFALK